MIPARHERRVGEVWRQDLGNLVELPADRLGHEHLRTFATAFAAAMRAGDRERLATLVAGTGAWSEDMPEARREARRILRLAAYRRLRQGHGEPPVLLVETSGGHLPRAQTHPEGFACFCRTADCAGLWPISTIDADAGEDRPYVCIQVVGRPEDSGGVSIIAPDGGGWLAEPDRRSRHSR